MKRAFVTLVTIAVLAVPAVSTGTHVRPLSASLVNSSLVPAYEQCVAPDRMHGSPLAFPSCSGPQQTSDHLTVGTSDANGKPAQSRGRFRVVAYPGLPGPPTDNAIGFHIDITDVRCKAESTGCPGAGEDYSGTLQGRIPIQATDHHNGPPPNGGSTDPGTGEFTLAFEVPCAATSDQGIGSTCAVHIDYIESLSLVVHDGERTLWEFDRLQVWDGGADGDGDTAADNTLFAVQGLFVP